MAEPVNWDSQKIVYITPCAMPLQFFTGLPTFLQARGFELHAVSSPERYLWDFCADEGCHANPVPLSRSVTPLRDVASVVHLWRTLRRIRPAIVESHMSKAGLVGMMAAWLAGVPIRIYTNHGVAFSSATGWKRTVLKMLEQFSCRLASHVRCVSFSVCRLMVAEHCCKEQKIRVLANGSCGLDAKERFNPNRVTPEVCQQVRQLYGIPPDALVLGFVGRIATLKGIDDLTRAWQVLKQEHPNLHLLIVGGVDTRNPIHPQTDALLRTDPRVHFSGEVVDTVPYYCAMNVQVLPSFHEGLPISLLEGAAMQLPLVASRIPGNVEAVQDGVTGTLFPARDVSALVEAISRYLKNPMLRRKHGLAGRMYVLPNFQREIVWEACFQEYAKLLQQAGMSTPQFAQHSTSMIEQNRQAA